MMVKSGLEFFIQTAISMLPLRAVFLCFHVQKKIFLIPFDGHSTLHNPFFLITVCSSKSHFWSAGFPPLSVYTYVMITVYILGQ